MRTLILLLSLIAVTAFGQGLPVKSGATTDLWTIDTNKHGTVSAYDYLGNPFIVRDNYLQVGEPSFLFYDPIEGSTLQTNLWTGQATTQTMAVATGVLTLNSSNITTANTFSAVQTIKQFNMQAPDAPILGTMTYVQPTVGLQANQSIEVGFSDGTSGTAATNGCFFLWNPAGELRAYLVTNGTSLQSSTLAQPSINTTHTLYVEVKYDECDFFVDDVQVAAINQTGTGVPPIAGKLPFEARVYLGATPPATAPRLQIYSVAVMQLNVATSRDYSRQMVSAAARGSDRSPVSTYAQTANAANSAAPTSATLSNTTAGYSALGGRYQFAMVAGAATDYELFAYQVPTGFQLHVTGVAISTCNTGAAVATTANLFDWAIAAESSATSLATTDTLGPPPTSWAPKRIPVGTQGMPLAAPNGPYQIGDCADTIVRNFEPGIVVNSGRFFHIILQIPVGTATASEVIRGDVMVTGWFE